MRWKTTFSDFVVYVGMGRTAVPPMINASTAPPPVDPRENNAITLGLQSLKSLILINGTAAAGLLTFYGNFLTKNSDPARFDSEGYLIGKAVQANIEAGTLKWAIIFFATGVVCAAVANAIAFIGQVRDAKSNRSIYHSPWFWWSISIAGISGACFVGGVVVAVLSFP